MTAEDIVPALEKAVQCRVPLFDERHESAFRLFNGFSEGNPDLVIDVYATTLVLHNYAEHPARGELLVDFAVPFLRNKMGWLRAGMVKIRHGASQSEKRGRLLFGQQPDRKIREHGIWYSVDLTINRDTSFYLDTRNLRRWLMENARGRTVLNTFAYTGSLGVAAMAGGAKRVVQHDLNRQFLDLAKTSYTLNGLPVNKQDFVASDFFTLVSKLKRVGDRFDCVILDPPFFSITHMGKVDQQNESARLINKVRPLVTDGGFLITINNALYLSGADYMQTLTELCRDGYLMIRELLPIPDDFIGYNSSHLPITDPTPFNHSTKIAILEVKRKSI